MCERKEHAQHNWIKTGLTAFVLLTCLRVWVGPFSMTDKAEAQAFDPAAQRAEIRSEAVKTNRLLQEIHQTLKTQTFKVRVEGTDKQTKTRIVVPRGKEKRRTDRDQ